VPFKTEEKKTEKVNLAHEFKQIKHVPPGGGVGWEGTLFLELIGLPQTGMECGGSSVEINRF
jgi:hypothetical protein